MVTQPALAPGSVDNLTRGRRRARPAPLHAEACHVDRHQARATGRRLPVPHDAGAPSGRGDVAVGEAGPGAAPREPCPADRAAAPVCRRLRGRSIGESLVAAFGLTMPRARGRDSHLVHLLCAGPPALLPLPSAPLGGVLNSEAFVLI